MNPNIIVAKENKDKGEDLVSRTSIENLVDQWGKVIVLGKALVNSQKSMQTQ